MSKVTVLPAGVVIDVDDGEPLAAAAWRQGYWWPTSCWGNAVCTACATLVVAGAEHTVPADEMERTAMRTRVSRFLQQPNARLACQLRVTADGVVVEKRGVSGPDYS